MWLDKLKQNLAIHEGRKLTVYTDTVGKSTFGVGHNVDDKGVSAAVFSFMLAALSVDQKNTVVNMLLEEDVRDAVRDVKRLVPAFDSLSDNRKIALTDFVFNIGYFKMGQFTNTLRYINAGQWENAADNILKSLWAKQVGQRAKDISEALRNG